VGRRRREMCSLLCPPTKKGAFFLDLSSPKRKKKNRERKREERGCRRVSGPGGRAVLVAGAAPRAPSGPRHHTRQSALPSR